MSKRTTLEQVREFHETYCLSVKDTPDLSDPKTNQLRINLLAEELEELQEAIADNDPVEVLDALIDLQYVLDGAFLSLGFHDVKDAAFNEVHRSNMSKLGADGKPIVRPDDGKILKGPDFFEPDMAQFIKGYQKKNAA